MNHSTKIASLFLLSASAMLALPACAVGTTGAEDESQENQGAPEQGYGAVKGVSEQGAVTEKGVPEQGAVTEKGVPEQGAVTEKGSAQGTENIGEASQRQYGYGYYPPGYAPGLWYGGAGYFNPGFGYYQPGYGYLPGGYGYNYLAPGYGFWRPGYGYWRPGYGYWRGFGRRYGWGW